MLKNNDTVYVSGVCGISDGTEAVILTGEGSSTKEVKKFSLKVALLLFIYFLNNVIFDVLF